MRAAKAQGAIAQLLARQRAAIEERLIHGEQVGVRLLRTRKRSAQLLHLRMQLRGSKRVLRSCQQAPCAWVDYQQAGMHRLCEFKKPLQLPRPRLQLHVHQAVTTSPFLWPETACRAYAALEHTFLCLKHTFLHSHALQA